LQEQIAFVENESDQLADEIRELLRDDPCNEEIRLPKKSTINEMMLEPDPDNEDPLFTENQQYIDSRMRQYLKAFGGE